MRRISLRSLLKPALLCTLITLAVLLINPWDSVWVSADQLNVGHADEMRWNTVALMMFAPLAGGLVAGVAIGRQQIKHYRPMMKGGFATFAGLILGLLLWGVLGGIVHGVGHAFASVALGSLYLVMGGAAGFIIGGLTARKLAWGVAFF
jgi:hypothetical protein